MNDFTASNGWQIRVHDIERVTITSEDGINTLDEEDFLDSDDTTALREFFRAEEDKSLGRWRWPDNPRYVVYPLADEWAFVIDESAPWEPVRWNRIWGNERHDAERAAVAYFEAHPEPKPWREAGAGEVWLLTINRETDVPAVASSSEYGHIVFTAATFGAGGTEEISPWIPSITAGRRIWPEVTS